MSSSVTSIKKCLSTFLRLTSRPTRRLIASRPRSRAWGERTALAMVCRIFSVAHSRSSRLRARS